MRILTLLKILLPAATISIFNSCGQRPGETGTPENAVSAVEEPGSKAVLTPAEVEQQLHECSLDGDIGKVKEALEAGAAVNSMDAQGVTALMSAAFNGHSDIVLMLLDHGAGIDRRDVMGRTALLYAATGPFPGTVKILLDKGAEPNVVDSDEHFSPLMHAAAEGNLDVVKILVEAGADMSLTDVDGDDAISFARQAGHQRVADYLKTAR